MTIKEMVDELSTYPDEMEVKMAVDYGHLHTIEIGTIVSSNEWDEAEPAVVWICEDGD